MLQLRRNVFGVLSTTRHYSLPCSGPVVLQLQKRKQVAKSLREMNRENVAKLALREKQKIKDAEEDKRLMREYQERLDRQERDEYLRDVRLGKTVVLPPRAPLVHRPSILFEVETSLELSSLLR